VEPKGVRFTFSEALGYFRERVLEQLEAGWAWFVERKLGSVTALIFDSFLQ
jgi:hypothetical protein